MALKWGSMADGWDDNVDCRGATNWWNGWLKTNWPWEGDAYVTGCSLKNENSPCCACMSTLGLLTSSPRPPCARWLSVCRALALFAVVETWSCRDSLLLGTLAAFNACSRASNAARSAFNCTASSRLSAFACATSSRSYAFFARFSTNSIAWASLYRRSSSRSNSFLRFVSSLSFLFVAFVLAASSFSCNCLTALT